jgi:hypothetical protein
MLKKIIKLNAKKFKSQAALTDSQTNKQITHTHTYRQRTEDERYL